MRPSGALSVVGFVGEDATFFANLRLVSSSKEAVSVPTILASDLVSAASESTGADYPDYVVDRNNITIDAPAELQPRKPADVHIAISKIPTRGTYKGSLRIVSDEERCSIRLTVIAVERPTLVLAAPLEAVKVELANCSSDRCALYSDRLLSAEAIADPKREGASESVHVLVSNSSSDPVVIQDHVLFFRASTSGKVAPAGAVEAIEIPRRIDGVSVGRITLSIAANDLPAGDYAGGLYVRGRGVKDALLITISLSIKDGPFFAILALILGLSFRGLFALVRLILPKSRAMLDLYRLKLQARSLPDAERQIILPMILDAIAQTHLVGGINTVQERDAIRKRMEALEQGRIVEDQAARLNLSAEMNAPIRRLREMIAARDPDPDARVEELRETWDEVRRAAAPAIPPGRQLAVEAAAPRFPRLAGARRGLWRTVEIAVLQGLFPALSGLAYLLVFVVLVALGLVALYFNDPAFGANVVLDYGALIGWGLGADLAAKQVSAVIPRLAARAG